MMSRPSHQHRQTFITRAAIIVTIATGACGGRGATITPGPTPAVAHPPLINCPAGISAESHVGHLPLVSFDPPSTTDGQPPVIVTCAPDAGSEFQVGTTTVMCEAADSLARKASCTFDVHVAPVPVIQKTKFMAFGDSLTEGKIGFRGTDPTTPFNYETLLQAKLALRYETQSITMVKEPQSGEKTGDGKWRFAPAFDQARPEVVLLLEGTNDLLGSQDKATIDSATDALRTMVEYAKARGAKVFIATLPPMNPNVFPLGAPSAAVPTLNDRIRGMAMTQGIPIVDLGAAIPVGLIGPDGKHPTAEGYAAIAEEFYESIVAALEVTPPALREPASPARARQ